MVTRAFDQIAQCHRSKLSAGVRSVRLVGSAAERDIHENSALVRPIRASAMQKPAVIKRGVAGLKQPYTR